MSKEIESFFKPHLFVEFFFGHDKMFLSEHMQKKEDYPLLFEEYGVFPKCREMAEQLTYKVREFKKWDETLSVEFNYNWVSIVNLKSSKDVGEAAYSVSESVWNEKLKKFDEVTICLNVNQINNNDFFPLLMHELTHAYQDYQLRLKGSSLKQNLEKIGANKNDTIYINSYEETKRRLAWVLYHINDFERSSYIVQINGYLDNTDKVFKNIRDVLTYLKNTIPYQNYTTIFEWCNYFYNVEDGITRSKILSWVEELSNFEFLSYEKFKNWLKGKELKYQNKFNTILPKLAYKHLNIIEFVSPTVNYLIK